MMKLGGISEEAANFLLDKIGEPYITRYVNHVSSYPNTRRAPYLIVPDIYAHNSPQNVNLLMIMIGQGNFFGESYL